MSSLTPFRTIATSIERPKCRGRMMMARTETRSRRFECPRCEHIRAWLRTRQSH